MPGGCTSPTPWHPQKIQSGKNKSRKKKAKISNTKKSDQNNHNAVYKWVKSDELTPNFVFQSPHLPKHNLDGKMGTPFLLLFLFVCFWLLFGFCFVLLVCFCCFFLILFCFCLLCFVLFYLCFVFVVLFCLFVCLFCLFVFIFVLFCFVFWGFFS